MIQFARVSLPSHLTPRVRRKSPAVAPHRAARWVATIRVCPLSGSIACARCDHGIKRAISAPLSVPPGRSSGGGDFVPAGLMPPSKSIDRSAEIDVGAPRHLLNSSVLPGCGFLADHGPSSFHQATVGGCHGRLSSCRPARHAHQRAQLGERAGPARTPPRTAELSQRTGTSRPCSRGASARGMGWSSTSAAPSSRELGSAALCQMPEQSEVRGLDIDFRGLPLEEVLLDARAHAPSAPSAERAAPQAATWPRALTFGSSRVGRVFSDGVPVVAAHRVFNFDALGRIRFARKPARSTSAR